MRTGGSFYVLFLPTPSEEGPGGRNEGRLLLSLDSQPIRSPCTRLGLSPSMFVGWLFSFPRSTRTVSKFVHAQQVLAVIWQVVEDGIWNSPSSLFQVLASALSLWGYV